QVESLITVGQCAGERGHPVPHLLPEGIREVPAPRSHGDLYQFFRMTYGKRLEDQRVRDAEDRGVGTDPEGEGEDGDEGEPGARAQGPCGVAEVGAEGFKPTSWSGSNPSAPTSATPHGPCARAPGSPSSPSSPSPSGSVPTPRSSASRTR